MIVMVMMMTVVVTVTVGGGEHSGSDDGGGDDGDGGGDGEENALERQMVGIFTPTERNRSRNGDCSIAYQVEATEAT